MRRQQHISQIEEHMQCFAHGRMACLPIVRN